MAETANFGFMGGYGQNLEALPALAESYFRDEPASVLLERIKAERTEAAAPARRGRGRPRLAAAI